MRLHPITIAACATLAALALFAASAAAEADTAPPTISIATSCTGEEINGWCTSPVALAVAAEDASGLAEGFPRCEIDFVVFPCEGLAATGEGDFVVRVSATDLAGNANQTSIRVKVDERAPAVSVSAGCFGWGADGWCLRFPFVSRSAMERGSGIAEQTCYLDGVADACDGPISEGTHDVRYVVKDGVGHVAEASTTLKQERVGYSGFVGASCRPTFGTYCSGAEWTFAWSLTTPISGNASGYPQCTLDGAPRGCSEPAPASVGDGAHRWTFLMRSNAGSTHSSSFTLGFDHAAPVPSLALACPTATYEGWCSSERVPFEGATTDALSGVRAQSCGVDAPAPIVDTVWWCGGDVRGEGWHVVEMYAQDRAGNVATVTREFGIDTLPPELEVTPTCDAPAANGWCLTTARATIDASDAGSGLARLSCAVDGYPASCEWPSVCCQGSHVLRVTAVDFMGHATTREVLLQIDRDAPTTTATVQGVTGENGWLASPATLRLACADPWPGSGCAGALVDAGEGENLVEGDASFRDGRWNVSYAGMDVAGNREAAKRIAFSVDATPPTLALAPTGTAGLNGWWRSAVTVQAECADATSGLAPRSLALALGDGEFATNTSVRVDSEGATLVRARCADAAGNVAESEIVVRIDRVAPAGAVRTTRFALGPYAAAWSASDAGSGLARVVVLEDAGLGLAGGPAIEACAADGLAGAANATGACALETPAGASCYRVRVTDEAGNEHETPLLDPVYDAEAFLDALASRCATAASAPASPPAALAVRAPGDVLADARRERDA